MDYACPVCETPEVDAEHLANHLAFTALLGDDAHESWLDDTVPDWGERDPETLGPAVVEHADEVETPADESAHDHSAGREDPAGRRGSAPVADRGAELGDADRAVLREAREMTERMYGLDEADADDRADEAGTADDE
ncbi:MAG: DUF5810 domain-containing protein [Halobacteriaceae archaeon]